MERSAQYRLPKPTPLNPFVGFKLDLATAGENDEAIIKARMSIHNPTIISKFAYNNWANFQMKKLALTSHRRDYLFQAFYAESCLKNALTVYRHVSE